MAWRANEDGVCWMSLARLARETRLTKRTIIKNLPIIEASGEITIERRSQPSPACRGEKFTNIYTIKLPIGEHYSPPLRASGESLVSEVVNNKLKAGEYNSPNIDIQTNKDKQALCGYKEFITIYPNPINLAKAQVAWVQYNCSAYRQEIMHAVSVQCKSDKWLNEKGRFIPGAEKYLREEQWKQVTPPSVTKKIHKQEDRTTILGRIIDFIEGDVKGLSSADINSHLDNCRAKYLARLSGRKDGESIIDEAIEIIQFRLQRMCRD